MIEGSWRLCVLARHWASCAGLIAVLVRLLWPRMRKRSGRLGGKGAPGSARAAILNFFTALEPAELRPLLALLLAPIGSAIRSAPAPWNCAARVTASLWRLHCLVRFCSKRPASPEILCCHLTVESQSSAGALPGPCRHCCQAKALHPRRHPCARPCQL